MDFDDPLLTSEDVAKYLKVDVVTVRRLVSRGELAAFRVGSEFRFSQKDLSEYLKHQYMPARPGMRVGVVPGSGLLAAVAGSGPFGFVARALEIGIDVGRSQAKTGDGERFTPRAAQSLIASDEIARQARSPSIVPMHLLLGLLREGTGVAGEALAYFGITERQVNEALGASVVVQDAPSEGAAGGAPKATTLSAEVKRALEAAVKEANRLGHGYLGTEHLLLGLMRDEKGPVAELLAALNAPVGRVRKHVLDLVKAKPRTP